MTIKNVLVSRKQCVIDLDEDAEMRVTNLSNVNPTLLNGVVPRGDVKLRHGDVLTLGDRCCRFEYPEVTVSSRYSRETKLCV